MNLLRSYGVCLTSIQRLVSEPYYDNERLYCITFQKLVLLFYPVWDFSLDNHFQAEKRDCVVVQCQEFLTYRVNRKYPFDQETFINTECFTD